MFKLSSYILLISIAVIFHQTIYASDQSVSMKIANYAGSPIELWWINSFVPNRQLVKQTEKPIRNASEISIDSYDSHQFTVKFLDPSLGKSVEFTKGPSEEIVTVSFDEVTKSLKVIKSTKYDDLIKKINSTAEACRNSDAKDFSRCVSTAIIDDVTKIAEKKELIASYRNKLSHRLRNYTCSDDSLKTSMHLPTSYNVSYGDKTYEVRTLLEMDSAKVWYVNDFITDDECDVLTSFGKPRLARATVAGEDGSSVVSENRKAQQAHYDSHYTGRNPTSDPLWPLADRILKLTNAHTGYNLTHPGQEGFTIIQYDPTDQYTAHCDGACDGLPHHKGGRIATAVLYCKAAIRGGATTFTKADLIVRPKRGTAAFFSYKGSNGNMDEGFTEHSSCPVIEGEKWVTTMWMRDGVSAAEPWTMFDPSGIKMLEPSDYPDHGDDVRHDL